MSASRAAHLHCPLRIRQKLTCTSALADGGAAGRAATSAAKTLEPEARLILNVEKNAPKEEILEVRQLSVAAHHAHDTLVLPFLFHSAIPKKGTHLPSKNGSPKCLSTDGVLQIQTHRLITRITPQAAERLTAMNDPSKGGSGYLQSKIFFARDTLVKPEPQPEPAEDSAPPKNDPPSQDENK